MGAVSGRVRGAVFLLWLFSCEGGGAALSTSAAPVDAVGANPTPLADGRAPAPHTAALGNGPSSVGAPAAPTVMPAAPVAASSELQNVGPAEDEKARLRKLLEYDPQDPLGNLEAADALTGEGASSVEVRPAGACRASGPVQRLLTEPVPVALAATDRGFLAAGYARQGEREVVRLVRLRAAGLPDPLPPLPIAVAHPGERSAVPGVAADEHGVVAVATVDGRGTLRLHRFTLGHERPAVQTRTLKEGVDTRFAPAVAFSDAGTLVAFAVGTTPMRTHVARVPLGTAAVEISDVTPARSGATAPTFVAGKKPPLLLAVDARDGMSPVIKIPLSHEGKPQTGAVVTAVSMVTSPTQLAAASGPGGIRLGYIGLGQAASTAVGIIAVDGGTGPEALVRGDAYGPLHVAAVPLLDGLLFAADAPRTPGKAPQHDIALFHIDGSGERTEGRLRSGEGDASHVAMASDDRGGAIGLAFTTTRATYLQRLSCR